MSIRKNQPEQRLRVFAFNANTNLPVTGDAANITANLRLDYGAAQATNDTNPNEIEDGNYEFLLLQAETNANVIDVYPESSTPNVVVIGVPARIFTSPSSVSTSLGLALASRDALELKFGVDNIRKWADLDNENNTADISGRVDQALAYATEDMYDRMRGGPITVPITDDPPLQLVDVVTALAGVWLYENRGVNDAEDVKNGRHRLIYHRDRAYRTIAEIRSGKIRLSIADQAASVPQVIDGHKYSTTVRKVPRV